MSEGYSSSNSNSSNSSSNSSSNTNSNSNSSLRTSNNRFRSPKISPESISVFRCPLTFYREDNQKLTMEAQIIATFGGIPENTNGGIPENIKWALAPSQNFVLLNGLVKSNDETSLKIIMLNKDEKEIEAKCPITARCEKFIFCEMPAKGPRFNKVFFRMIISDNAKDQYWKSHEFTFINGRTALQEQIWKKYQDSIGNVNGLDSTNSKFYMDQVGDNTELMKKCIFDIQKEARRRIKKRICNQERHQRNNSFLNYTQIN